MNCREGGSGAEDAFLFLLTNFNESARLWVRLQQQSSVRDRAKRENERQDLRVLVGSALVRMAQLEGMTVEFYKTQALPAILQQVCSLYRSIILKPLQKAAIDIPTTATPVDLLGDLQHTAIVATAGHQLRPAEKCFEPPALCKRETVCCPSVLACR